MKISFLFISIILLLNMPSVAGVISRGTISNPSGHILYDTEGNRYNVDSLLDEGKFFVIHLISDT